MALGNKGNDGDLIILKLVTQNKEKQKCKPYFSVTRKVDGQWTQDKDGVISVAGDLVKVETETKEFEGSEYGVVKVYLKDSAVNELYLLDLRFTIPTRSLFNALINLEDFTNINLSLYENERGYANCSIWQNDEMIRWKYDLEEIPAPAETQFKGKTMRDYTEPDEFFAKKLNELNDKIHESANSGNPQGESQPTNSQEEEADPSNDDIPF